MKPLAQPDESERLRQLASYHLLDTLPEQDYDDLTRLAANICDTPISLVSLVDDHRQWFKSRHGLPVEQTPKEFAFCAHAIEQPGEPFIIPDARKDERFMDNPLVTGEPRVTFYAGIPLLNEEGYALGTLCVIDHQPRQLTQAQITSLKAISRQAMNLIELRRKKHLLEHLNRNLESRNDELEQFAHHAAHDLKSPLNNITMVTDILQNDFGTKLPEEGKDLLGMIQRSSEKLKSLVDGLLAYSKIDKHAQAQPERIELRQLYEGLRELLDPSEHFDLSLETQLETVDTNRVALEQVLLNLMANAIKYNDKELPEIVVSVTESPTHYHIAVADNGPGIPEELKPKLFDIFQTGIAQDRFGKRGNGIGLATVRKVVTAMGGEVEFNSKEGDGATFEFSFEKADPLSLA